MRAPKLSVPGAVVEAPRRDDAPGDIPARQVDADRAGRRREDLAREADPTRPSRPASGSRCSTRPADAVAGPAGDVVTKGEVEAITDDEGVSRAAANTLDVAREPERRWRLTV
jgi:hypothetical protein